MKVKMKQFEQQAIEYAQIKFPKQGQWAEFVIAKDTYMLAYNRALQDADVHYKNNIEDSYPVSGGDIMNEYFSLYNVGQSEVEVEFTDGDHQL